MATSPKRSTWRWITVLGGVLIANPDNGAAAPSKTFAELTVPAQPPAAQQQLLRAVAQIAPQREEHRRYRMAIPYGAPLFPPDADLAAPPAVPALAAWLAMPAEGHRYDVLITPDIDYYWQAEGRRYSCQFLIHIETRGGGSALTITQVRPTEYLGKYFNLLGRTGPGLYMKMLPTTPSAGSEAALRGFLEAALDHAP